VTDVQNWLEFSTGEDKGLGADLPAGRIRVYQEDTDGAALLIGENQIDHTPKGEDVKLYLGNAFDLVGEHTQTNFQLIASNVLEETYEIHLRTARMPKRYKSACRSTCSAGATGKSSIPQWNYQTGLKHD